MNTAKHNTSIFIFHGSNAIYHMQIASLPSDTHLPTKTHPHTHKHTHIHTYIQTHTHAKTSQTQVVIITTVPL